MITIRPGVLDDLPALTDIYNHYIVHTPITFDVRTFEPNERRPWFDEHSNSGRHRLLVAEGPDGVAGYATTSRWRPKPAYDTTVESSVYCHPDWVGRDIGTQLYEALFAAIADADVHQIVAGATLPNAASVKLHDRLGFRQLAVFTAVGRKFDRFWDVAWFQRPLKL